MKRKPRSVLLIGVLGGLIAGTAAAQTGSEQIISIGESRAEQGREAQAQIEQLAEETRDMFDEYQILVKSIENDLIFNELMDARVTRQEREIGELQASIDQVTMIERSVMPLMTRMIDGLEQFIELGLPFRIEERRERVEMLRGLLLQSDVPVAEQFRFVIQGWQLENDYGRFPETYTGELRIDDVVREVDFFMLGRVALYYVTPDNSMAGIWDRETGDWAPLTATDAQQLRAGISMLQPGGTPQLLMLPIAPPQEN